MRRLAFVCLVLVAAALPAAPEAFAAKKKAKATATAPAKQTAPYAIVPDTNLAKRLQKSGELTLARGSNPTRRVPRSGKPTPVRPVRRDSGFTTIAPYPVPYDTSRDAAQRGRTMNVPKPGGGVVLVPAQPPARGIPAEDVPKQTSPDSTAVPKWGDYVYVTDLPEAIVRVPPNYPAEARAKGIQGTVMVKALVLKDGTVREAHASEPLQYLDRAAEACVLQWRFKPAMSGSTPVAVWVSIPVKFTLH